MKKSFTAELLSGHKQLHALEVPFDPAAEWKVKPQRLWPGRHGFRVNARVKGRAFESSIVPRQKRFFLLIDSEVMAAVGLEVGSKVRATIEPVV